MCPKETASGRETKFKPNTKEPPSPLPKNYPQLRASENFNSFKAELTDRPKTKIHGIAAVFKQRRSA